MIGRYLDKFIRITFDNLKVFIVFFGLMQVGTLYVPLNEAFIATMLFSLLAFIINYGLMTSDGKLKNFLPIVGLICSFIMAASLYKEHTLYDKIAIGLYHLVIWVVSARNLRPRVMAKRTVLYVFMPVIVLSLIFFALRLGAVDIAVVLGLIYPYVILFYGVTFMLAVKLNLEQGYKREETRTINTINMKRNRLLYSGLPNLLILIVMVISLTSGGMDVIPAETEEGVGDDESNYSYATPEEDEEASEDVVVEQAESVNKGKKPLKEDKIRKSLDFSFLRKLKFLGDVFLAAVLIYFFYYMISKTYKRKLEIEEEDEYAELKESLLTGENISKYFKNLLNKLKPNKVIKLPRERQLYMDYIKSKLKQGFHFEKNETPRQFKHKLIQSSKDEIIEPITQMYSLYKYAGKETNNEELNEIENKMRINR